LNGTGGDFTVKARIAVFVSGGGTNLQALFDACANRRIVSGEIKLVISSRDGAYALERARARGIPAVVCSLDECGSRAALEDKISAHLEEHRIELIVLAGYMSILSPDFVSRWPERIINVHPSLIPAFCGAGYYGLRVHKEALERGVKITGATVHFVNEIPDGGKIIAQKAVCVYEGDTPESLQRRVMEQAEWVLLPRAVEEISKTVIEKRWRHCDD
jgi:phosphoribosylglycinamide formyltransferase-1